MSLTMDSFPCGCVVTNKSREVIFTNSYLEERFGWSVEKLIGQRIEVLLTPASHIFCESYVFPMLCNEGKCEEIQLTLISEDGTKIPIIANSQRSSDPLSDVYWSLFAAENRDKLYQELLAARDHLERQKLQLLEISKTDSLTGLMNRRAFDQKYELMLANTIQLGLPISVLFLDIDHFKLINDEFGHDAGDYVLRKVGECLRQCCRSGEIAARYGGEEFVFILSNTCKDNTITFANRIHENIQSLVFNHQSITVSIGIFSDVCDNSFSSQYCLQCADRALYQAKQSGRDKSVMFVPEMLLEP